MTKTKMPQARGGGEANMWGAAAASCWRDAVKIIEAIATKKHASGPDILTREAESVKLYSAMIVLSKLTKMNQITNQRKNNKNIIKLERSRGSRKSRSAAT
jgi:hypothetical protein